MKQCLSLLCQPSEMPSSNSLMSMSLCYNLLHQLFTRCSQTNRASMVACSQHLAVDKKMERPNSTQLRQCQLLLNAVPSGICKCFEKCLSLDAAHDSKGAILASAYNPQFKLKWLPINRKYSINVIKRHSFQHLFLWNDCSVWRTTEK